MSPITATIIIPENAVLIQSLKDWMSYTYQLHHRDDDPIAYDNSPRTYPCYAVIDDVREGSGRHLIARFHFYYLA